MTTAIFWRFLWKEYRVMRAFWIAMACLAVLAQLALVAFPGLTHYSAAWTFSFALIFPALYAVACGATMFAAEKEEGTYEFLRSLPVTAWRLLSGKFAFAVISTVLLIGLLRLTGDLFLNGRVYVDTESRLWGVVGLATVEGLAWGIFFSLLLRRPLQAAMLAIAAASVAIHLIVWSLTPWSHWDNLVPYLTAVPYRAGIAALVFIADLLLLPRWLATPRGAGRRWHQILRGLNAPDASSPLAASLPATRGAVFGRMAWQTWRQSRGMMLILAIVGGLVALASPLPGVVEGYLFKDGNARIAVISATAALMGSCVFLADQEGRRFRYFGEHAVPFRAVWLAKLLTWFAVLCIWAIVVHGIWFLTQGGPTFLSAARESVRLHTWDDSANHEFALWYEHLPPIALSVYLTIAGFACGQLGSMFLRSGILAAFVGLVSTLVLYGWAQLMQFLEISWLWSLCPIPLVLLFATWLRTPDWILERNTWRGWLRVAAALALPLGGLVAAMALYRIDQIPNGPPGFSPDEYARSIEPTEAAKQTADMFVRATYLLTDIRQNAESDNRARPPDAGDLAFLHKNNEALDLALKAAQRSECSFHGVGDPKFGENSGALVHLLAVSTRQLESEGKLDEAWDRWYTILRLESELQDSPWSYYQLPYWAAQPGQTRERIVAAIKQLQQFETTLRSPADRTKSEYLRARRAVTGGPDAIAESHIDPSRAQFVIPWSLLPWERSRSLRLLNVCTVSDLGMFENVRQAFAIGNPVIDILHYPWWNIGPLRGAERARLQLREKEAWLRTTLLLTPYYSLGSEGQAWSWTREETQRRATRIIMAIVAWKLDHQGELPERLSQLRGKYLDELPLDPYSGAFFYYVREGITPPPKLSGEGKPNGWPTVPRKPFIWSIGERVRIDPSADIEIYEHMNTRRLLPNNPREVSILDDRGRSREPVDEYDVWLSGQWFEIP